VKAKTAYLDGELCGAFLCPPDPSDGIAQGHPDSVSLRDSLLKFVQAFGVHWTCDWRVGC
jgi:hypothetical protein